MAEHSAIEWTHDTFNPWWGCVKVSPACAHCYAERDAHRYGYDVWGPSARRRFFSDEHWNEPLKWNRAAARQRQRRRVFAGSMCDILEDRDDLSALRGRLWRLIEQTPWLDWLLLSKRPENYVRMVPDHWMKGSWPRNAWAGTTTENQEWADRRIPHLLKVPAPVRFISAEPLLGPIDLGLRPRVLAAARQRLDWIIAGGETGPQARPTSLAWARHLRDQAHAAGVAFFWKHWGEWVPVDLEDNARLHLSSSRPTHRMIGGTLMQRVGKTRAGRLLDGREWNEIPEAA